MSKRSTARLGTVVRGISRVIAVALVLWALSDDALIGGGPGFGVTQSAVAAVGLLLLASSFAPLAWNGRALALVVSLFFVLIVGEIGVRLVLSPRYQRPFQAEENLIYGLVPDSVREHRLEPINGGTRILYRVNHDGYRGEELRTDPDLRVVVYGDSFIQGEFSTLENTFVKRLELHLSERLGRDVEVVNAGVAGYGPDQSLRKMERDLKSLAPDLVVMAVFAGNDFGDLLRNKLFRVEDDGALSETAFSIDPEQQRGMQVRGRELLLKRVLREAVHGIATRVGLREPESSEVSKMNPRERLDFFSQQHVLEYEQYIIEGDDVVRELAWDSYDADVSLQPNSEAARYKARLMDAVLERMRVLTSKDSIPLVLLPIPHPIDVGGHDTGEIDAGRFPDYEPRGLVGILEAIGSRRGIPTVDLFSTFDEAGSHALYLLGFDDHWNDQGQDLAGELVAEFLVERALMPAPPRTAEQNQNRQGANP